MQCNSELTRDMVCDGKFLFENHRSHDDSVDPARETRSAADRSSTDS
jgi:hypothetical protein